MTSDAGPSPGTLSFDIERGLVRLGAEARLVVPVSALMALWGAASPAARRVFGRALGESIGHAAAKRLATAGVPPARAMTDARPEAALSELSAAWALAGLGALGMERRARALIFVIDESPLGSDGDGLCEVALEGALSAASGKSVSAVKLERAGTQARFFLSNAGTASRVRAELSQGTLWADVLAGLEAPRV